MSALDNVRRAVRGLAGRPRSALLATLAIAVAVMLLALVRLVSANVDGATAEWRSGVDMIVYLEDGTSRHRAQEIQDALAALPAVDSTEYVGAEAALDRLRESLGEHDELAAEVSPTMLPASIEVSLGTGVRDVAEAHPVMGRLEGVRGVEEVEFLGAWVDRASALGASLTYAAWFITLLVGLAVAYMIGATLRLSLRQRRRDFETLELLGATRRYVRAPMILEGIAQGAAGAAIAVAMLWALYRLTSAAVTDALVHAFGTASVHFLPLADLGMIVAAGAAFGLVGSFMATGPRALARA